MHTLFDGRNRHVPEGLLTLLDAMQEAWTRHESVSDMHVEGPLRSIVTIMSET